MSTPGFLTELAGTWDARTREWVHWRPLAYRGTYQYFEIPVGQRTDLASKPALLSWAVSDDIGHPSTALHDYLWRVEAPAGRISYRDADGLFRQALRTEGVDFTTRWLMWTAVRWGALTRKNGWRGWWRDAPKVLLVTLLASPLLVLAIPLLPALGLLWVLRRLGSPKSR